MCHVLRDFKEECKFLSFWILWVESRDAYEEDQYLEATFNAKCRTACMNWTGLRGLRYNACMYSFAEIILMASESHVSSPPHES